MKTIPKYIPVLVIDGKTTGIKKMMVQGGYDNLTPIYVEFDTTNDDTFYLTLEDAREAIDAIEDGKVIYIKKRVNSKKCDQILHWGNIVTALSEYRDGKQD